MRASRSVQLTCSGIRASIVPDPLGRGSILTFGAREQSHVDPEHPEQLRHDYLRRMAHVLDDLAAPGAPLRVLHLGAGALTLVRYLEATRPGSPQTVIELERELVPFVTAQLPLAPGTRLQVVVGDARESLAAMVGERWDALVLDVFTGEDSPAHLACEDFYREALAHLTGRGVLLVNIGDEPGLRFWARQARALDAATADASLPGPWTLTDSSLLAMNREGNLVLAAGGALRSRDVDELRARLLARGPHPAAVLDPEETADLAEAIS